MLETFLQNRKHLVTKKLSKISDLERLNLLEDEVEEVEFDSFKAENTVVDENLWSSTKLFGYIK